MDVILPEPGKWVGGQHLPVGTRIGEFEITGLIGEGGFGVVYLAHDRQLDRRVALKEYMPGAMVTRGEGGRIEVKADRHREAFESGLRSFVNEARLLAQFEHPALVKVYRFWESNGTAFMVMPYYEGQPLREVVESGSAPPSQAWLMQLLAPLMAAIEVLHAQQCYHRDIAPDNILILPNGQPLLLDFGAARRVIGDMTQALTVILKPGFAPVEQYASGPEMPQGPWTDVYGLAAVIYHAATGQSPIPSVSRLISDNLVPLGQASFSDLNPAFCAAVDRGLAVKPLDRWQSIAEFRQAIEVSAADASPVDQGFAGNGADDNRSQGGALPGEPSGLGASTDGVWAQIRDDPDTANPGSIQVPPVQTDPLASPSNRDRGRPNRARASRNAGDRGPWLVIGGITALAAIAGIGAFLLLRSPTPDTPQDATAGAMSSLPGSDTGAIATAPSGAEPSAGAAVVGDPDAGPANRLSGPASESTSAPPSRPIPSLASGSISGARPVAPATMAPFSVPVIFQQIFDAQTPGHEVRVATPRTSVRIGQDQLRFTVTANRDGYLYLLMRGTDERHLYLLFPNELDRDNRITAGQPLELPRSTWVMDAAGPPGLNVFLALVTPTPRNFAGSSVASGQAIPEFDLQAAEAAYRNNGALAFTGEALSCRDDECRTFGAARFTIREVGG